MVNTTSTFGIDPAGGDPLRALALSYAPADAREGVLALFALDATLRSIVARARERVVAQMRLAWWDEALRALDERPPPAQPILRVLAVAAPTVGVRGADLADLIDGWERLLNGAPDDEVLRQSAEESGGRLFRTAAALAGASDAIAGVGGTGWALATLGEADADLSERGRTLAGAPLGEAARHRWSRRGRFLGALIHAARRPASPARVPRLAWHRLTGR